MGKKRIEITVKGSIECDDNQDEVIEFVNALKSGVLKPHHVCDLKLASVEVKDIEDGSNQD